jgi:hypothetical protein
MVNLPETWPFPDAVIAADPLDPPVIADRDLTRQKKPETVAVRGNRGRKLKPPVIAGEIDDAPF